MTASYDAGNRLTTWQRDGSVGVPPASATGNNNPSTQQWSYDDAGNWNSTTKDGTTEARNHSTSDQITQIANKAATHDRGIKLGRC